MASDSMLREVIEHVKKTIQFLEKLPKLDKKLRPERDGLIKELNAIVGRYASISGDTTEGGPETYDDVDGVNSAREEGEVYNDVEQKAYDDLGNSGQSQGGDTYDDTSVTKEYDDLSPTAIVDIPCDKLINPTKADYLDFKKDAGLAKLILSPWQKRFCVIHKSVMYMYESPKDKKPKEAFLIKGFQFKHREDISKEAKRKERCFEIKSPNKVYEKFRDWRCRFLLSNMCLYGISNFTVPRSKVTRVQLRNDDGQHLTFDLPFRFCAPDKDAMREWGSIFGGPVSRGQAPPNPPSAAQGEYNDLGPNGSATYDDTSQGNDVYEDTNPETNYNDTQFNQSDTAPTPQLPPQRRPSARDEFPLPPASSRPPMVPPSKPTPSSTPANRPPPALPPSIPTPPREDTGRPPMLPPTPTQQQRSLPEPPGSESNHSPSLPPLPPPPNDEPELSDDTILESFGDSKSDYINMYQGMWDCYPDESNELMFKRGEIIHILSRDYDNYGWWVAENTAEDIGLVPVSYIMKAFDI